MNHEIAFSLALSAVFIIIFYKICKYNPSRLFLQPITKVYDFIAKNDHAIPILLCQDLTRLSLL